MRAFFRTLLVILTATLGIAACGDDRIILPTLTPTPTHSPAEIPAEIKIHSRDAEYGAWGWMSHNRAELGEHLARTVLEAAPFMDASDADRIARNTEVRVTKTEFALEERPLSSIPIRVESTFTVDHPEHGGTYTATLSVSLSVDPSLPLEQIVTGYSIDNKDLSLHKHYSR